MSVGVGGIFESVCLSVCLQHNSKTNDPKMFKLGVGNDLGIPHKWCCFGVQRLKVKVTGSVSSFFILYLHTRTAIHRYSLGGVTSRLRFCGCLVCASLTFARWHNQSSVWVRTRDRVPSSYDYDDDVYCCTVDSMSASDNDVGAASAAGQPATSDTAC